VYLTKPDYGIDDFLKAVNFIAPRGTTLEMFIVPKQEGQGFTLPVNSGFAEVADLPPDESITYRRSEPVMKQDMAAAPIEYSYWDPQPMGRKQPSVSRLPNVTEPEELESPFVKILAESNETPSDFMLREDWMMFPRGTIFHVKKSSLREMEWHRNPGFIDSMMNDFHPASVQGHEIGDRWRGSFPAGVMEHKIQRDAWNLYKEGYTEEEIVDLMLEQKWYQKQMKRKNFGTREDLLAFVTDWVREQAEKLNSMIKDGDEVWVERLSRR
jgi:hypothetical protein